MSHDRTYHPQICWIELYWIEPGLSPRIRGVVKHSLAVVGLQSRRLPAASVRATIHVKYLSGYLPCPCQVEDRVDNIFYLYDFSHWLKRLQRRVGFFWRDAWNER